VLKLFSTVIEPYYTSVYLKNERIVNVIVIPNRSGGLIFVLDDVSNEIKLNQKINSLSLLHKETLDQLSEGIMIFGLDNKIKIANIALENIWGTRYSPEIHVKDFFNSVKNLFTPSFDIESWISKIITMTSNRVEVSEKIDLSDKRTIMYDYSPLSDALHLIKFYDATDIRNLQNDLKNKTEEMMQLDKIKSNLISNISQEISVPLNTIFGFCEIIKNQYFGELNSKQLRYCNMIFEKIDELTKNIQAMITLTGMEIGKKELIYEKINLEVFINEIINLFQSKLESKNITIQTDFLGPITAYFNEDSMRQAVFYIVMRAIKVTPPGNKIIISFSESAEKLDLSVSDTGQVLDHEELYKLRKTCSKEFVEYNNAVDFEIVFANGIAKLHKGNLSISVKVDNEKEIGTVITLSIPQENTHNG
ncbi:MAG: HAMP domain-containing histidine kinase, partial [Holosporales bacterium]|nr:HAMP domain-containing histidine kinase [Holosporales bacterium]